jgi:WhiB family redox-sensing transcriptional regulator
MNDYAAGWRAAAACLSADPDLFFPVGVGEGTDRQIVRAQRICADCQVRQECLDFAMRSGQVHGIWGGTTPEERTRARRRLTARHRSRRPSRPMPVNQAS